MNGGDDGVSENGSLEIPKKPVSNKKKTARDRLVEFCALFGKEDQVLVVINADPDAIASAMAVKRLLRYRAKSVTIG